MVGRAATDGRAGVPLLQRFGFRALLDPRVLRVLPWAGILLLAVWSLKPPFWGSDGFTDWFAAGELWGGRVVYHAAATNVGLGYFFYPPPLAQLLAPTSLLPFPVWILAWSGLQLLALRWLAGSVRLAAILLFVPFVPLELQLANIHLFLAVALALGYSRWPAVMGLIPLTKIFPLAWFGRPKLSPLVVTIGLVALSFLISPQAWIDWVGMVTALAPGTGQNTIPVPWAIRLVLAAGLVLWSRRLAPGPKAWLLVTATWLTIPTMWINSSVILLAGLAIPEARAWLAGKLVGDTASGQPEPAVVDGAAAGPAPAGVAAGPAAGPAAGLAANGASVATTASSGSATSGSQASSGSATAISRPLAASNAAGIASNTR